ncbi:MAG: diaminopimelate epimerase [Deltaproteobacteria bacterium]|nr:diaminopimelate epimerase [Deltaproteobacteria bacterium]
MKYLKYHALGNDYIVLRPDYFQAAMTPETVRLICHRNYGIGSDGILYGPLESKSCDFGLRIFNPDGSEAEKSGNGLRIFARSLYDEGLVKEQPFSVETPGGIVSCKIENGGSIVTVQMGSVSFDSRSIPVTGPPREVLNEELCLEGQRFTFCAASVGNPHCVILTDNPSRRDAERYGTLIENDSRFPHRINVQFMKVMDRGNIQIEIWERGAGYTLASGSSSTAAAAVAYKLGLCDQNINVHMPGGSLKISFSHDFLATMTGPVAKVCEGVMADEMFAEAERSAGR